MDKIDLRSDTVTWPTPKMRQAMLEAPLGDDVYGEDPTINRLEAMAAERFGKEAGLFVTSGSMGNLASILAHCGRGDEVIMGQKAHTFLYESGNPAASGGVHSWPLTVQEDGTLRLEDIEGAIRRDDPHFPKTKLVSVENTQGSMGGIPLDSDYINSVGAICREHGMQLHIDGARIFNAAAAVGEDVATITKAADSVTFCLSKGLCAPVGSVIVGREDFIYHARRVRKMLGGGMRQAGILAAAGIVALEEMTERLVEDHENACILAQGLATIPSIEVDPSKVKTNMIFWRLREDAPISGEALVAGLAKDNIVIGGPYRGQARFVTHYWISREHVELVVERMRSLLA
jgi:threonine aldolase